MVSRKVPILWEKWRGGVEPQKVEDPRMGKRDKWEGHIGASTNRPRIGQGGAKAGAAEEKKKIKISQRGWWVVRNSDLGQQ